MKKITGIVLLLLTIALGYLFITKNNNLSDTFDGGYGGLTVEQAQNLATERGVLFRVVEQDGEPLMVTMDYVTGRVNAEIENDIVVGYTIE